VRLDRWLDRSAASRRAAVELVARCDPWERIARAGARDPERAADRLLPRDDADLALAAMLPTGELAAVANANGCDRPGTYEVAVLVAPEWRRRGIAQALLRRLAATLPAGSTLVAMVRSDDTAARALVRSVAPTAHLAVARGELDVGVAARAVTTIAQVGLIA
jgi:ribosomal protein S18 acetylase RimI-like enzyme